MILSPEVRDAVSERRDRIFYALHAAFEGRFDLYSTSVFRMTPSRFSDRLNIGAVSEEDRGEIFDDQIFLALAIAKAKPDMSAWSDEDRRVSARVRTAAMRAAERIRVLNKVEEGTAKVPERFYPPSSSAAPFRDVDFLTMPSGRMALVAFGSCFLREFQDGTFFSARMTKEGFSILARRVDIAKGPDGDRMPRIVARPIVQVEGKLNTDLFSILFNQIFFDFIVFPAQASVHHPFESEDIEVFSVRSPVTEVSEIPDVPREYIGEIDDLIRIAEAELGAARSSLGEAGVKEDA